MLPERLWTMTAVAGLITASCIKEDVVAVQVPRANAVQVPMGNEYVPKNNATLAPSRAIAFSERVFAFYKEKGRCPSSASEVDPDAYWREPFGREWQFLCAPNGAAVLSMGVDGLRGLDDVAGAFIEDRR